MRIAILTVYDAPNCGSFLQAYATKKILEEKGHSVSFIRYRNLVDEIKLVFANERTNCFHPFFYIRRGVRYLYEQKHNFSIVSLDEAKRCFDKFIIGSDELWNVRNDKYFTREIFYGSEFSTENILILAISCNESEWEDFDGVLRNRIRLLKNISYRDVHTGKVIQKLNNNAKYCCDPTIIAGRERLTKIYKGYLPEKYMVVYAYHFSKEQKACIVRYAKENNLRIVSMCSAFAWADINMVCSPLYFSDIIRNADCVVSATFHGCVFSLLNNKKLVCLKDTPKIKDLLERYICLECIILNSNLSYELFSYTLSIEREWNPINNLIQAEQMIGNQIIDDFLVGG